MAGTIRERAKILHDFGGRDWSAGARGEIVDFIQLSFLPIASLVHIAPALYASGLSLSEVAGQLGKGKDTVRRAILKSGLQLRPSTGSKEYLEMDKRSKRTAHAPYGFVYIRGKLVAQPTEIELIREMLALRGQGLALRQISNRLNDRSAVTRNNKIWRHFTVSAILERIQKREYPYSEIKEFYHPNLVQETPKSYCKRTKKKLNYKEKT